MRKLSLIITFFTITFSIYSTQSNITLISGSNVYIKIFLFFFPVAREYNAFFSETEEGLSLTLEISRDKINNEPIAEDEKENVFNTDLIFNIRSIPVGNTGIFKLPLTIRCNRKIIRKDVNFTIVTRKNVIVLKGASDILLGEINDSERYRNRSNWKYPFHFDLRIQLPNS